MKHTTPEWSWWKPNIKKQILIWNISSWRLSSTRHPLIIASGWIASPQPSCHKRSWTITTIQNVFLLNCGSVTDSLMQKIFSFCLQHAVVCGEIFLTELLPILTRWVTVSVANIQGFRMVHTFVCWHSHGNTCTFIFNRLLGCWCYDMSIVICDKSVLSQTAEVRIA